MLQCLRCVNLQESASLPLVPVTLNQPSHYSVLGSSLNVSGVFHQSSSSISPTGGALLFVVVGFFLFVFFTSTIFPSAVRLLRSLKIYTSAPLCCPGPSSLDFGGVVLGQDLHQYVPPVQRVSEPAQLARDLRGGGNLWGRQNSSDGSGHTRQSPKNRPGSEPTVSDTHRFLPYQRSRRRGSWKRGVVLLSPCL